TTTIETRNWTERISRLRDLLGSGVPDSVARASVMLIRPDPLAANPPELRIAQEPPGPEAPGRVTRVTPVPRHGGGDRGAGPGPRPRGARRGVLAPGDPGDRPPGRGAPGGRVKKLPPPISDPP